MIPLAVVWLGAGCMASGFALGVLISYFVYEAAE